MDWNGNGHYDPSDRYMDQKIMNEANGSNGSSSSGGGGGIGCGTIIFIIFLILAFINDMMR